MGKLKDQQREISKMNEKAEAVLGLLRKQAPLTARQEKFCSRACVERFLRAKGENVKKAAKHLRACLYWRDSMGIESLTADDFLAELADGAAYVAGFDDSSRPVIVFRVKQDYQRLHSQNIFTRLLVFTLEVAISTMPKNVEHLVLLFDASLFRSASAFMNSLLATLKILSEYYPRRLFKAFVIDPPSLFSYLWKGVRPFVEQSTVTTVVSSLDYEDSPEFDRISSLRFNPSSIRSTAKIGPCASSRFAFTVSPHFDSLKPWYLSLTDTSASKVGPSTCSPSTYGPGHLSPLTARSLSFASPSARSLPRSAGGARTPLSSTPLKGRPVPRTPQPRTSRPSFLQSPATFFRRECRAGDTPEKPLESFVPYLRFYRRQYNEMAYRAKIPAHLRGHVTVVSPHIRRRHVSLSQRF